jgi:hypothetical protein
VAARERHAIGRNPLQTQRNHECCFGAEFQLAEASTLLGDRQLGVNADQV